MFIYIYILGESSHLFFTSVASVKLCLLLQCSCNNETEIPSHLLQDIVSETHRNFTLKVIFYIDQDTAVVGNQIEDRCGQLCENSTPKKTSSLESLLYVTFDLIRSEKERVESDSTNELHIISITPHYDTNPRHFSKERYHPLITSILEEASIRQTSLHFLVEPKGQMKYLGDPLQSVTYTDHTHFNKGLTLASLISSGQGESIQAHFLSAGLYCSLAQYNPSTLSTIIHSSPFFWSALPFNVQYQDKCGDKDCSHYCSPIHGCMKESDSERNSIEMNRVSLSEVEFVTSHADINQWSSSTSSLSKAKTLSILEPSSSTPFPLDRVVTGIPKTVPWTSYEDLVETNKPLLIDSSDLSKWPALSRWSMSYLSKKIKETSFVKCSDDYLTFDPDSKSPLKLNLSLPYKVKNMSSDLFFDCVEGNSCSDSFKGHYYFGPVPDNLKSDVTPDSFLYRSEEDLSAARQYVWISSPGMITHGHFDQDYNLFTQILGTKRFTFWSPSQHESLYMFPRIHPLWHKSRINFRDPDVKKFPAFSHTSALQVTVGPGDLLFIPPYTWHYVETLSPSVSLSTWSHDYHMYYHMNSVYGHDHKFDLIASPKGQMYTLRLYLDMLIQNLYGFNETTSYFARLLANRFSGLEDLFPPEKEDMSICEGIKGEIPLSYHTHGFVKLDVQVIGEHFKALSPEVMDILFGNYVEEIASQVVGVDKILAFFRYCFQGQAYTVTSPDQVEHSLWDYPDLNEKKN